MSAKINYWHMQMHPTDQTEYWEYLEWILEHRQFIGLGQWQGGKDQIDQFQHQMKVNDVVAIKKGSSLIALVQIIGGHYIVPEQDPNNDERYDWIVNRRPIRVLDWNTSGRKLPDSRKPIKICKSDDAKTTKVIKGWHEQVMRVMKKRKVNLTV